MTYDDRIDASPLTVLLDVRQPFAYLALGPTIALGRHMGVEINWLPCSSPPLSPPPPTSEGDERSVAHRRNRARMIAREIEVYGEAQGLTLRDYYRDGDWKTLEQAILFMRDTERADLHLFLQSTFAAYWAGELDPMDVPTVAEFVDRHGGSGEAFGSWSTDRGPAAAEAVVQALRSRGMSGAPAYHVAGEFFQGRQHLPMIEWLLGGRSGPGPI